MMTDPSQKNNNNNNYEIHNLLTNFANSPTKQVWLARPTSYDQTLTKQKWKYFGEEIKKSGKKLDKRLQGECSQSKEKSPFELPAGVIGYGQAVLGHRPAVRNSNSDAVKKKKPLHCCHVKR